jgi:signal peptidase I
MNPDNTPENNKNSPRPSVPYQASSIPAIPPGDESIPPKKNESFLKEIVKFALIAIVIIVPIRTWVAEPFIVSGLSMFPTFNDGQYLIVDQLTYDFQKPQRGDVIIFKYPLDPSVYFIKRIIGLPGETVSINDGVVTITKPATTSATTVAGDLSESSSTTAQGESVVLSEPYIEADHRSYDTDAPVTLGPTQYFVMCDNRNQSSDSRIWGPVDQKFIVGRPYIRLLPPSSAAILPGRVDLGNN